MRRFALSIALAACSAKQVQQDAANAGDPAPQIAAPQTGRHASSIEIVAVSDDGNAALTQDVRGGTRLWPALDGTREPVVFDLSFATSLALGRTSGGFVVAALDESGGLEIVELDGSGRVMHRTSIGPDPAIQKVVIEGARVLALRADQLIVAYGGSGAVLAQIAPPEGHFIQTLATRSGHTVALTDTAIAQLEGTTWGTKLVPITRRKSTRVIETEVKPVDNLAVSPDGTTLALELGGVVSLIGLDPARPVAKANATIASHTIEGEEVLDVGFVDNNRLVINWERRVDWIFIDDEDPPTTDSKNTMGDSIAVGNGMVVRPVGTSLILGNQVSERYLGYHATSPVVIDTSVKRPAGALTDMQRLDESHVLVTRLGINGWKTLAVVDTSLGIYSSEFSAPVASAVQRYEPSTRLLAVSDQEASYLVQYDLLTRRFETWFRIEYEPSDLYVLDPAQADNAVALAIRTDSDGKRVRAERFYVDELKVGSAIAAHEINSYDGRFYGADHTGRVFVAKGTDLRIVKRGEILMTFRNVVSANAELEHTLQESERSILESRCQLFEGGMDRVADPVSVPTLSPRVVLGPAIALVDGGNVALLGFDGTEKWRVPAAVRDLRWIGDDLVGTFAGGTAVFDPKTGALAKRTCGWDFGLRDTVPPQAFEEESICEAR